MPYTVYSQTHGNLSSYRSYVRPMIHNAYGQYDLPTKHQKNIHSLLYILFAHGSSTTWEMAKIKRSNTSWIRRQDKIYRRLLVGRFDRGKYSSGLIDMGLVVSEKVKAYHKYRLSLYGILYCIDVLDLTEEDYDKLSSHYSYLLPRIFRNWKKTKKILQNDAYNLKVLSQGIYLNNIKFERPDNALYELMMFIHIKYSKNFESISEYDLSEQISYWFYTFLLYSAPKKLPKILSSDKELHDWYNSFFQEAKSYYEQRLHSIQNYNIL